jgi:hypothetical protein
MLDVESTVSTVGFPYFENTSLIKCTVFLCREVIKTAELWIPWTFKMSTAMLRRVVSEKLTEVSEEFITFIRTVIEAVSISKGQVAEWLSYLRV